MSDQLLNGLLRGIERDALNTARNSKSVLLDHRGREIHYQAPPAEFRGEIAVAVDDIYGLHWHPAGWRYNPDQLAIKKGGLKIYHEMRLDDQAKAALHLKKSAIIHPGWDVECEDEQLGDFVRAVFNRMAGTPEDMIRSILSAYDYGFSLHEKVYSYIEDGPFKGKIGLAAVKQKSPTRIQFRTDEFGNLQDDGILQQQPTGELRPLPVRKFILFSYQKEFDNYYGQSDLRAAYRFWFLKVNFFRYWGMYLERFGMPIVIGTSTNATLNPADQTKFQTIIKNIQAGMSAVLPPDLEVDFKEAAQSRGDTFSKAVDACDVRISRAVLMPTLLGLSAGQDKGSLARSQTEADTFDMILGGDSRAVSDIVNEQVVRELVEMNFGVVKECPRFVFKPMREEDKKEYAKAWADAVSKKAANPTMETDKHVRSLLGFPEMTPEEETEINDAKDAEAAGLEALAKGMPPGGPGAPGKGKGKGNGKDGAVKPDKPGNGQERKVYVITSMNAQEARVQWEKHLEGLDDLEDDAKIALSEAFEQNVFALSVDARKKS